MTRLGKAHKGNRGSLLCPPLWRPVLGRLSAARRNAWAGGMLYRDSVSLTPLIQIFRGRPLCAAAQYTSGLKIDQWQCKHFVKCTKTPVQETYGCF